MSTLHVRCTLVWKIGKKIYTFVFKIAANAFYVGGICVIHITVQYCAMTIFTIVVELCKIYELFMCQSLSHRFAMHLLQHQITYKHSECGWIRVELIRFGIVWHFQHHGKRRVKKNGGKHSINLLLYSNSGFQYFTKNTIKHFQRYHLAFYNIFKIV